MNFDPKNDGIDHINIFSRGQTDLGIFLSNFTKCDLETEDGKFQSVEGYWYWLSSKEDSNREPLRTLYGNEAKKFGRTLIQKNRDKDTDEIFKNKIKSAIKYKIDNNQKYKSELINSSLPLTHYYIMYGKIFVPNSNYWVIEYIDEIRKSLQNEKK